MAFFFFLSGYGLQKSYIKKSESYKKGFLLKRIPSILIPYIIITAVYWMWYFITGTCYSLKGIIIDLIEGSITANSWYIINILVFYVFYWLLMIICKKHYFLMILMGVLWYFLWFVFCRKMNYGEWWYNASHILVLGMLWATYENKILDFIEKYYLILSVIVWSGLLILFIFKGILIELFSFTNSSLLFALLTAFVFVLSVLMLVLKLQIGNKALEFLGGISLEIYLSQGLFFNLFRYGRFNIENDFLYGIAVLAGTLVFSYFLNKVFNYVLGKYRKIIDKLEK